VSLIETFGDLPHGGVGKVRSAYLPFAVFFGFLGSLPDFF